MVYANALQENWTILITCNHNLVMLRPNSNRLLISKILLQSESFVNSDWPFAGDWTSNGTNIWQLALILHFKDTTSFDSLQIMIQSCFINKPYFMTLKRYFITSGCVNILQKLKSCIFVVWLIAQPQDQLLKIWHSIS